MTLDDEILQSYFKKFGSFAKVNNHYSRQVVVNRNCTGIVLPSDEMLFWLIGNNIKKLHKKMLLLFY